MTALQHLVSSNQTRVDWEVTGDTLISCIERQAHATPQSIALTFEGQHLTYTEMLRAVHALAADLQTQGCRPGDFVALLMDRCIEMVISTLAVMRIGAIYVPLDPQYPPARLQVMLDDCRPSLLLTAAEHARGPFTPTPTLNVNLGHLLRQAQTQLQAAPPQADDLCYAIYTSGSTGLPKAALNNHRGVHNRLMWERSHLAMGAHDVVLQKTPYTFDVSVWELFSPLMFGARLVIAKPGGHLDPLYLSELIVSEQVTMAHFVPSMLRIFLDSVSELPQCLTSVKFTGEPLAPDLVQRVLAGWPKRPLINCYGPTECAVEVTTWDCRDYPKTGKVLIGTPMPNVRTYVLDEHLNPTPAGDVGELYIAGLNVGNGYLNRPELTAERFVPDPFAHHFGDQRPAPMMYRSGDLVIDHPEQGLEYLGRTDFQVKVNGVRIELGDIEAIAMQSGLLECVMVAVQPLGLQSQRLIGLACPKPGCTDWEAQLVAQLQADLPATMVPLNWFEVDQLPLTSSGKTDRNAALAEIECRNGGRIWPALATLFEQQVRTRPEAIAVEVHGASSWTYGDLDRMSGVIARSLQGLGVGVGDHVALMMGRSFETILAMLSVTRIGAIYAPIDSQAPAVRQQQMLDTLGPKLIITAHSEQPAPTGSQATAAYTLAQLAECAPPGPDPWTQVPGHSEACVLFTSGSTGRPKGVRVPHEGIARLTTESLQPRLTTGIRWAWLSSPAFDATHLEVWGPLLNGGAVVLPPQSNPSLDEMALFLSSAKLDGAWLTTALFNVLVDHAADCLNQLGQVAVGGERLSPAHIRLCMQACPQTRIVNGYGPTEGCTFAMTHTIRAEDLDNPGGIPIGVPIRATGVRLAPVSPETVPGEVTGAVGELVIGGPGVAFGYLGGTESQNRAFVMQGVQRWYHTGDLVRRRPDGLYEYLGRIDQQVKIQGNRIELEDVEHALMALPGVKQAVAVVVGRTAEDRSLAAVMVLQEGQETNQPAWLKALGEQLPPAAVPRLLEVIQQIPLTINGKADRSALVELMSQRLHASQSQALASKVWASPLQEDLAKIWHEVLPRSPQSPSAHFQLCGGTSIAAMKLAALIQERLGRKVPPGELILHPTLQAQSEMLALLPVDRTSVTNGRMEVPLSEQQQGLVLSEHMQTQQRSWLVHVPLVMAPPLPWAEVIQAFKALALRHLMLRTVARVEGHGVTSHLLPETPDSAFQDCGTLVQTPAHLEFPLDVLEHVERPLDPQDTGPMRVDIWHLPDHRSLLIWSIQHHVIDEIGIDIALTELDAILKGQALPALRGDPQHIVTAEQEGLDQELIKQTAQDLGQALQHVQAPWPISPGEGAGEHRVLNVPPQTMQNFIAACVRWESTPFAPLLAAYGLALQSIAGAEWRHVYTPFTRRTDERLTEPVNYCLDVRHIEAGRLDHETPAKHLARVRDQANEASTEGFMPLPRVQELLAQQFPTALPWLTQFAMTWREDTRRSVPLGRAQAHLLAYPHRQNPLGLTLHVERNADQWVFAVTAAGDAFTSGFVSRLEKALNDQLTALANIENLPPRPKPPAVELVHHGDEKALRDIWVQFAPSTHWGEGANPHFLKNGGTSLAAIRMAVEIRRTLGLQLHVPGFMASPTFDSLASLCSPVQGLKGPAGPKHVQWVGDQQAPHVVFLIPGHQGHAVSLVPLAMILTTTLGADFAVAISDLETLMEGLPSAHAPLQPIEATLAEQIRGIGAHRVRMLAGFSLGGQLALRLRQRLSTELKGASVCLLDTYDMRATQETLPRRLVRKLMRTWYRLSPLEKGHSSELAAAALNLDDQDAEAMASGQTAESWHHLMTELLQAHYACPDAAVCLLRARFTMNYSGLLLRRESNGFNRRQFTSFDLIDLPAHHMELPRRHAPMTADALARWLGPRLKATATTAT
jgi:amino acid adenylation domain-containing protein